MKKRYCLLFLLFVCNSLFAQTSSVRIDNKEIQLLDTTYTFKDTTQKIFIKNNQVEIWNLRQEITKLSFDHCNHKEINILLYSDTTGEIPFVQLITGTSLTKIDSTILSIVKNYSKKMKPVVYDSSAQRSLIYLKYLFHYKKKEEDLEKFNGNYNAVEAKYMLGSASGNNITNECEDDAHFYDAGVENFRKAEYSQAIYNFNRALKANQNDWDALFNLGLSYQRSDKLQEACECFSRGIEVGDSSALKAYNKFCAQTISK